MVKHKALLGTVGASFFVFALQAVQGMLLARVLGPEGRGQYNTAVFYTHLLMFAGMLGIPFVIQRLAAGRSRDLDAPSVRGLSTGSILAGLVTGLFSLATVGVLAYFALPAEKRMLAPLCLLAAVSLPLLHGRLALQAVDRGSENFLRHNVSDIFFWAALPLMLSYLWWSGEGDVQLVVVLMVTASLLALLFRVALGRGDFTWPPDPRPRRLLREGMPYALAKGVSDVLNRLDGLLILLLASFTIQGYYAAAVPAAAMLSVAPAALTIFAFNAAAKGRDRASVGRLVGAGLLSIALQGLSAIALALALPTLILLVFGQDFAGAIPFALALVPAKAVAGLGQIAEGYLRGRNQPHIEFRARLAGGVILLITAAVAWPWLREFSIPLAALTGHAFPTLVMAVAIFSDARRPRDGREAN